MTSIGRKTFQYFAFGSNLLKERITINNPTAVFETIGKLQGYKLVFCNSVLSDWQGGAASIEPDNNLEVWGVVWTLGLDDLPHLDKQENGYERMTVNVETLEGKNIKCETYRILNWEPRTPSRYYKDVIVRGAKQHSLPRHYIQQLENIQHNSFEGQIQVYENILKRIEMSKNDDI